MVPLALAARARSRIWAWTLAKELDGRDQGDASASPASAGSGPVSAPGARPGEAPLPLSSPAAAKQARYLGAEPGNDQGSAELGPTRHHGHGQAMGWAKHRSWPPGFSPAADQPNTQQVLQRSLVD